MILLFLLVHLLHANEVPSLLDLTSDFVATNISLEKDVITHLFNGTHSFSSLIKTQMAKTLVDRCVEENVVFNPASHLGISKGKIIKIAYSGDYTDVLYEKVIPHISVVHPNYATDYVRTLFKFDDKQFKSVFESYDATDEDYRTFFEVNEKYVILGQYNVLTVLNRNHELIRSFPTNLWVIENVFSIAGNAQEFYVTSRDKEDYCQPVRKYNAKFNTFSAESSFKGVNGIAEMHILDTGKHTFVYDSLDEDEHSRPCYIRHNTINSFPSCRPLYSKVHHVCVSDDAKYAACVMQFTKKRSMIKIIDLETLSIDGAMNMHEITLPGTFWKESKYIFLRENADRKVLAVAENRSIKLFECPQGTPLFDFKFRFSINNVHTNSNNLFVEKSDRTIIRYPFWFLHSLIGYMNGTNI